MRPPKPPLRALILIGAASLSACQLIAPTGGPGPCPVKGFAVDSLSQGSMAMNPCAISGGKLKCWGSNVLGYLGLGDQQNRGDKPEDMGSCLPEIDLGSDASVVAVAEENLASRCALLSDERVKCWGNNVFGQLGLGDTKDRGRESYEMGDRLPAVELGRKAIALSAGSRHVCAILDDRGVKCWGAAPIAMAAVDLRVSGVSHGALAIASGAQSSCAILDDHSLFCWPVLPSANPPTGLGSIPLDAGHTVAAVAMGSMHACVILNDGHVKCWGGNSEGALGIGRDAAFTSANPAALPHVELGSGHTARALSAGAYHTCAILENGQLKCWGRNTDGQLGLGDMRSRGLRSSDMGNALPAVDLGPGRTALQVSAGVSQTCALLDDRTVKCWGQNADGRLGQADRSPRGGDSFEMGDRLSAIPLW